MKKLLFALLLSCVTYTVGAQIAIQEPRFGDNIYVGLHGGVTTPLSLNKMFPINPFGGISLGKEFNPIYGIEAEGSAWVNDNGFTWKPSTWVKAINLGVNGTTNLSNLFFGYPGKPRIVEFQVVAGLGWLHSYDSSNDLSSKTGLRLNFNLGKNRAWTASVTPAIWWNLSETGKVQFNQKYAQMGVQVGLAYHFRTSSGEHYFKGYDVGSFYSTVEALNETLGEREVEISELRKDNIDLEYANRLALREVNDLSEQLKECQAGNGMYVVLFAQNSSELDEAAIACLDGVPEGCDAEVYGYASPEGEDEHNLELSSRRAASVAAYLANRRGCTISICEGRGVPSESSNRIVEVYLK